MEKERKALSLISFMFLFGPGALSYLLAHRIWQKKPESWFEGLVEWVGISYLDLGAFSLMNRIWEGEESGGLLPPQNEQGLMATLLTALCVGILLGVLGRLQVKVTWERRGKSLWEKLPSKGKRLLKGLLVGLGIVLCLFAVSYPVLKEPLAQYREESYRAMALKVFQGTRQALSQMGDKDPKTYGSLMVEGVCVKQVEKDQYFAKTGSGQRRTDAVYMVDGEGTLVYFSIRDKTHGSTWSGPSTDKEFLEAHQGWNGGAGWGWNGVKVES